MTRATHQRLDRLETRQASGAPPVTAVIMYGSSLAELHERLSREKKAGHIDPRAPVILLASSKWSTQP